MSKFRAEIPAMSTQILDDSLSRITQWDFAPGAATGHHVHGWGYVVVPMTDCDMLIEDAAGSRQAFIKKGAAYRREAGTEHNVINGGDLSMSFIEIEYK